MFLSRLRSQPSEVHIQEIVYNVSQDEMKSHSWRQDDGPCSHTKPSLKIIVNCSLWYGKNCLRVLFYMLDVIVYFSVALNGW